MFSSIDQIRIFLRFDEGLNFKSFFSQLWFFLDSSAILSRLLVKSLGLRFSFLRQTIWQHEWKRGLLYSQIYRHFLALESFDFSQPIDFLEIGAGPGALAEIFAQGGWRVRSLDLLDGRIFASDQSDFLMGKGEFLPFRDGSFTIISLTSVLHHIPPELTPLVLKEVWRVLKPGGYLLIQEDILSKSLWEKVLARWVDDLVSGEIGTHQAESHRSVMGWVKLLNSLGWCLKQNRDYFPTWFGLGVQKSFFLWQKS